MSSRIYADQVTRREVLIDGGICALILCGTLAMLGAGGWAGSHPAGPAASTSSTTRGLDLPGAVLALASALPLLARRTAPLTAYVLTSVTSVSLVKLGYSLDAPIAQLVAVYTLAGTFDREQQRRRRWPVMAAAAVFIPTTAGVYAGRGDGVRDALPAMVGWALVFVGLWIAGEPGRWRRWAAILAAAVFIPGTVASYAARDADAGVIVPAMASWALVFSGVWIAGDRARYRRRRLAELQERVERAERDAERERRLAAAEERTRIARELHDSAGHAINVILVQAGAARLLHDRDPARSRQAVRTIEDVARATLTEIARLVVALREDDGVQPPAPVEPAAFDDLLERHRDSGLTIAAEVHGSRDALPGGVAWAAYRILQEALTNAARHGPGQAEVTLAFGPEAVEVTVTNPAPASVRGAGRAAGRAGGSARGPAGGRAGGGHGIIGMRERALLLGGTLHAQADGAVFRLHARLPKQREAA